MSGKRDIRLVFGCNVKGAYFRALRISLSTMCNRFKVGILKGELRSLRQTQNEHIDIAMRENAIAQPEIAQSKEDAIAKWIRTLTWR